MKKIISVLILLVVFISFSGVNSFAQSDDALTELYEMTDEATRELLNSSGIDSVDYAQLISVGPGSIAEAALSLVRNEAGSVISATAVIIVLLILFSAFHGFFPDSIKNDDYYGFVQGSLILVSLIPRLCEVLSSAVSSIYTAYGFVSMYVPVFTAFVSSSGQPAASFTYSACVLGFAQLCNTAAVKIILPLISVITAVNVFFSLSSAGDFGKTTSSVRKIITVFLSAFAAVFVGLTNLKLTVTSSADSLIIKGFKTVSGGFIPVIGSSLGDAFSAALSSVSLIRNTVGAFGIIAVAFTFLPSVIRLVMWYMSLSVCHAVSQSLGVGKTDRIIAALADTVSLVNVVLVLCALVFILTTGRLLTIGG